MPRPRGLSSGRRAAPSWAEISLPPWMPVLWPVASARKVSEGGADVGFEVKSADAAVEAFVFGGGEESGGGRRDLGNGFDEMVGIGGRGEDGYVRPVRGMDGEDTVLVGGGLGSGEDSPVVGGGEGEQCDEVGDGSGGGSGEGRTAPRNGMAGAGEENGDGSGGEGSGDGEEGGAEQESAEECASADGVGGEAEGECEGGYGCESGHTGEGCGDGARVGGGHRWKERL